MEQILELRGVSKQFPGQMAVDNVSFGVERGTLFALLGPSGCGKTTTLRMVAGFEEPTSGEIRLNGQRINRLRPYERNVSTVFQNYALFPHLTVRGNIEFGLRRKGLDEIGRRVTQVLELVQLASKAERMPGEISGGERQRVALARSLVLSPDILLLDEPLSALDPNLRRQVRAELKSLQRRVGITFLFVTHDQEEALSMSDTIAVMNRGRVEQIGTPQDIYLHPQTRFVAAFMGAMNWVNGIGIRPEATRLCRQAHEGVPCHAAKVHNSVFLGSCVHIEARLEDGTDVTVEIPHDAERFVAGEHVHVWWHPDDQLAFPDEA